MRATKLGIAVAVAVVLALGSGCNPDKNKLYFKPQQGSKRTVDAEMAMNTSINIMGMAMNFGTSTEYTFDMTAQSVDEMGTTTFDVTIKSLGYEMTGLEGLLGGRTPGAGAPGMPQLPGLPSGDDPFGLKSLKTAIKSAEGKNFTVKVSKLGEVTEVTGVDAIAEEAASNYKMPVFMPRNVTPAKVVKQTISDEQMKNTMQGIFTVRPDKKLNIGETWQEKTSMGAGTANVNSDATYTVKERAGGTVSVDNVAQISIDPSGAMSSGVAGMPDFKMELSGQGTGTLKFDESSGWVVDAVASATIPGNMSMSVPQAGNMSIPVEASYKVTVKSFPS